MIKRTAELGIEQKQFLLGLILGLIRERASPFN